MPNWRKITITLEDRPVRMPNGDLAPATEQPLVGTTIRHWADETLAYAWLRQARIYLNDTAMKQRCDAPPNFSDQAANFAQASLQHTFVARVARAIAQYYNALNLVAMNDPAVRKAYHRWISGPPAGEPSLSLQINNWFKPTLNFGGGSATAGYGRWFFPNEKYPIFGDLRGGTESRAKPPMGNIAQLARSAFEKYYPRASSSPSEFVINVAIPLRTDPNGEETPASVEYQNFTRNVAETDRIRARAGAFGVGDSLGQGYMPDGTRLPPYNPIVVSQNFWDWRAVFFDMGVWGPGGDGVKLGLVAPMRAYLDFLHEIVSLAERRTLHQVIQDTRVFVAWVNARQIITGYDNDANGFLRAVSGVDSDVLTQQLEGDPGVAAASRIIGGVGSALGGAIAAVNPIAGGVVAIISGAVSSVLTIINRVITGKVIGKGVDDLGRWKPVLQRGVLSGSVVDAADLGMPIISGLDAPEIGLPPAPTGPIATPVTMSYDDFDWDQFKVQPPKKKSGGILPWVAAAFVVIGGAFAVSGSKPQGRKAKSRT